MKTLRRKPAQQLILVLCSVILIAVPEYGSAEEPSSNADLAQDLSNPLADLMSIPLQINYDGDIGLEEDGWKLQTNIQPVIPVNLNDNWNLITRTIIPLTAQDEIFPGAGSQNGLGDINLSLFLSPDNPSGEGVTWGIGPVLLIPTASDSLLGTEKWGAGPTAVILRVHGQWTVGMLANHVWSYGGDSNRDDISNTFLQPFAAYTWPSAWTVSLQSESSYNWESEQWSVPINLGVTKLVTWGKLPVSLQAGVGYWLESPDSGPDGVRFRFQATFVLPKLF
ncbi:MAG: transporter [Desulfobulbaceae bacterium]|nr:MAG: transporter [Desulfobulbaceae bacterium]